MLLYSRPGEAEAREHRGEPAASASTSTATGRRRHRHLLGRGARLGRPAGERGAGLRREVRAARSRRSAGRRRASPPTSPCRSASSSAASTAGSAARVDPVRCALDRRLALTPDRPRRAAGGASEDQAPVRDRPLHPDRLVDAGSPARSPGGRTGRRAAPARAGGGRGRASPRCALPRLRAAGSTQTCWSCTASRRPGRRLRLEQDRPVLEPDPRAALADLRLRAPAEAVGVALERVEPDLLLVRGRAGGDEQVEVGERRLAQAGAARLGRLRRARRRAGPAGPRAAAGISGAAASQSSPTALLLADHHPRPAGGGATARTPRSPRPTARRSRRRGRAPSAARRRPAREKRPSPRRATSSRKTRSTGSSAQKARICVERRLERRGHVALVLIPRRSRRLPAPCRSTSEPSRATTPRAASSPATRCGRSTSPRRSSTTPSR